MKQDVIARIKKGRSFPSHIDPHGAGAAGRGLQTSVPDGFGVDVRAMRLFFGAPEHFYRRYTAQYGDTFSGFIPGFGHSVFISNPEDQKTIFLKDRTHCSCGDAGFLEPLLGSTSLFVSEGADHKRHRALMTPPFHGERMRAYGGLIRKLANERIDGWKDGAKVSIVNEMAELTLDIIINAIFGIDEDKERHDKAHTLLLRVLDRMGKYTLFIKALRIELFGLAPWGRFLSAIEDADAFLYEEMRYRRSSAHGARQDIMSLLLDARDENGDGLSDQELRDELTTLLVAGHETTATSLSWAVHWLDRTPEVRTRLEQEVATLGDDATPEDISKNVYLTAFVDEVLRLEPTVPETTRILVKPLRVGGHRLAVGTCVVPSIWATHRRADIYPEPDVFRPERFIGRKYSPYEYLPFGLGVRRCIGFAFALYEMKMVIFEMVRRTRLHGTKKKVGSMRRNLSVGPTGGLPVRVEVR